LQLIESFDTIHKNSSKKTENDKEPNYLYKKAEEFISNIHMII